MGYVSLNNTVHSLSLSLLISPFCCLAESSLVVVDTYGRLVYLYVTKVKCIYNGNIQSASCMLDLLELQIWMMTLWFVLIVPDPSVVFLLL